MGQEYFTPRQVAQRLRVDYMTVMRWIRTGLLDVEAIRQGKRNRHRFTPGQQATDAHRMLGHLVATHRAIALLDPPANGTLTAIVGAIEGFSLGSFPLAIACQAMPEVPAIQKQEPQAIGQSLVRSFLRWHGLQIAPMHGFQFTGLLPLATLDQFT